MVIGITGYIGSGKSVATKVFSDNYLSYILILDNLAKEMIHEKFSYVNNNNFLNLNDANDIKKNFHPLVWKKAKEIVDKLVLESKYKYIVVETALPSDPFFEICDKTICIESSIDFKKEILPKIRSYTEEKIDIILKLQEEYKKFYNKCDYKIVNDSTEVIFKDKIMSFVKEELL